MTGPRIYTPTEAAARELRELISARHDLQMALSRTRGGPSIETSRAEMALVWLDVDISAATVDVSTPTAPTITPQEADVPLLFWAAGTNEYELRSGRGKITVRNLEPYERWFGFYHWAFRDRRSGAWILEPDRQTTWIGKLTTAMTGAADVPPRTAGSGSSHVWMLNASNELEQVVDDGAANRVVTVLNPFCSPLSSGEWIQFQRTGPPNFSFILTAAECPCE